MNWCSSFLLYLLTPLIWPPFITSCLIFWAYRKLLHIILRIRLGQKYGGLLDFSDAFSVFDDKSKCVINIIYIVKTDHEIDMASYTKECLQKEVFDTPENYPKMSGTLHLYKGYAYWLKNTATIDECVKTFPPPQNELYNEDFLKQLAGDIANSPLPQNDSVAWEFNIAEKPMVVKSDRGNIFRYPVLLRFHHVIGDGTTATSFLIRLYDQKCMKNYTQEIFQKQIERNSVKECLKHISRIVLLILHIVFVMFKKRLELIYCRESDINALRSQDMSGEKIIVWRAEDSVEFVPMVKKIKKEFPKTTFTQVVLTAISASLATYFQKKSHQTPVPNVITTYLTLLLKYPTVDYNKPIPLTNKSSAVALQLPVNGFISSLKTLQQIKQNAESITYFEAQTNILLLHYIFALFPTSIRKRFHEAGTYTAIISNVPAGSQAEIMDGCCIEKVIACPPNMPNIGLTMCLIGYDDRFQVGLMIDKSVMSSQEEAQEIVDDIFHNFKQLDIETNFLLNSS